jgi:hypothetical protein
MAAAAGGRRRERAESSSVNNNDERRASLPPAAFAVDTRTITTRTRTRPAELAGPPLAEMSRLVYLQSDTCDWRPPIFALLPFYCRRDNEHNSISLANSGWPRTDEPTASERVTAAR